MHRHDVSLYLVAYRCLNKRNHVSFQILLFSRILLDQEQFYVSIEEVFLILLFLFLLNHIQMELFLFQKLGLNLRLLE